jgi:hypothetical protein
MSTKTILKRIALVAVSALGFGLLSVMPASATLTNLTAVSLGKVDSPTDTSIVVLDTGSFGDVVQQGGVTIYTDKTYVLPSDLQITITSSNSNTATYGIIFSPDLVTGTNTITNRALVTESAATASFTDVIPNDLGAVVGGGTYATYTDDVDGDATADDSALLIGTHYLYVTFAVDATARASTTFVVRVIIANPTMTPVETVIANSSTTIAGRANQQVSIPITSTNALLSAASGARPFMRFAASITSQPSGSIVYPRLTAGSATINTTFTRFDATKSVSSGSTLAISASVARASTGDAQGVASILYTTTLASGAQAAAVTSGQDVTTLTFTPTEIGTYSITVWGERDSSTGYASLSGAESSKTFTVNVSAGVSTITLTRQNSSAATFVAGSSGINGALIKVSLRDASGNAAVLAPGEAVTITPSGTGDIAAVNGVAVTSTAGAAYNLSASNFNSSGVAWINLTDAADGSTTITAAIAGGANASTTVTFVDTVQKTSATPSSTATGVAGSGVAYSIPIGASTVSWRASASTGSSVGFTVTEALLGGVGSITGYTVALSYDAAAASSGSLASHSVTATTTANGQAAYTISADADGVADRGTESTATSATNTAGVLSITPGNVNAVVGASNTFTVTLKDLFRSNYANQTVTATVTGKNPTSIAMSAVTNASGQVTFTVTDANTNTAVSDTLTVTAGSSVTATIAYGTNAVGTVTLEYPNEDDVIAGTTFTEISAAGAGATGTSATVTAIITGSSGALLAGVPVTFAVSGLTGAEVHTTKVTVYTNTSGEAATSISSYAAGKATVTATAGGVSKTADIYFKQTGAAEARTIEATVSGGLVTATVKDRYGNTIEGVTVNATRTGSGYFGSGASTASGNTDKNGQIEFIFTGTGTVTVAFTAADYGQSADAAGKVGITAVTASAAGTTTTAQTGLGASLAPAGVNSASVSVASTDAGVTAAEAASDAAAEAIDAANAATDAANLAAEAADAATVAAEEARDAADAATAAVEELATQVATLMAALKAQITTLANTVAKIAKKVKA